MLRSLSAQRIQAEYSQCGFVLPAGWDEGLPTVEGTAADDPATQVREDALDVLAYDADELLVATHIPDVSVLGSVVGLHERLRAELRHRPDWQVNRFVQAIGSGLLMFTAERPVPVVTASVRLNRNDGSVVRLEPTLGQCQASVMTREEFRALLNGGETKGKLFVEATRLLLQHGAIARMAGRKAKRISPELVAEAFNSLASELLASYCRREELPLAPVAEGSPHQFTRPLGSLADFYYIANVSAHLRGERPPYPPDKLDNLLEAMYEARTQASAKRKAKYLAGEIASAEAEFSSGDANPDAIVGRALRSGESDERLTELLEIGAITAAHAARLLFSTQPGLRDVQEGLIEAMAADLPTATSVFHAACSQRLIRSTNAQCAKEGDQYVANLKVMRTSDKQSLGVTKSARGRERADQLAQADVIADACGFGDQYRQAVDAGENGRGWLIDIRSRMQRTADRIPGVRLVEYTRERYQDDVGHTVHVSGVVFEVTHNRNHTETVRFTASSLVEAMATARAAHLAYERLTADS